jgi:hypothetical protein
MKERPKKTRAGALVLAAAGALVSAFSTGVLVGRGMPSPRAPGAATSPEPVADPGVIRELHVCQQEVAALPTAQAAPPKAAAPPEEARQDIPTPKATLEELEAERKRCRKSEILVDAEVCVAAARHFNALMALPKDGVMCGPKSRAADLIEQNFESCAAFGDNSARFRSDDLTKEESSLIADATRIHQTLTEDELLRRLKEFVWTCTETPPQYPPGVNSNLRPKRGNDERTPQEL